MKKNLKKIDSAGETIKKFSVLYFSLIILVIIITLWPNKYSRITYTSDTVKYEDFAVSIVATAKDYNTPPILVEFYVTSDHLAYKTGEVLSRELIPSGIRLGNDGNYLEFNYQKSKSPSTVSIRYQIRTDNPEPITFSRKRLTFVSKSKTDKLPIISYKFFLKLCKEESRCKNYKINGKLKPERDAGYKFYNPFEFFNSFIGKTFILLCTLVYALMFIFIIIFFSIKTRTQK